MLKKLKNKIKLKLKNLKKKKNNTFPKKCSSLHLPPNAIAILSFNSSLVSKELSLGKYWANPREPLDLGIIVNLN